MKATKRNEGLQPVSYRLPKEICERLEAAANEHRRSINDELIVSLKEYFDISQILKDANMRDILASLANMPRNFGDSKLTKDDLKKFFNTYVEVMIGQEEVKSKKRS